MIIVDFETTGLLKDYSDAPADQPGIVQIGIVEVDSQFNEIGRYCSLINPEIPASLWDADAVNIHGIKPEQVLGAVSLPTVLFELSKIFRRHDTWVGYNNPFDRKVLYYQILRYGWGWRFPWPTTDLDIMMIGKDYANIAGKQDIKAPKLVELYEMLFGVQYDGAHDALRDCFATQLCAQSLKSKGLIFT